MSYGTDNQNGNYTRPTTTLGTPELAALVIIIDGTFNSEGEYLDQDSNFNKAVRGLQSVADVYAVFKPSSDRFVALVRNGTLPYPAGQEKDDGNNNTLVASAVSAAVGAPINAWNAEISGTNFNFD